MEVAGAEHQIQWEREEEEEREEELQMRRHRLPETIPAAVDFSNVVTGDEFQTGTEDENEAGNKSNNEPPVSENDEFDFELSLPGNAESKDELSVLKIGDSKEELSIPEDCESKDMLFVPEIGESNDELSVLENGESKDEFSIPEDCESKDMLFVPEIGESNDELSVLENGGSKDELSVPGNGHVHSSIVSYQYQLNTKDASLSDIKILPTEKSVEDLEITQVSRDITKNSVDTEVSKEGDEELNDIDVERVIKEQNAYDLFCPNCHSCITKRVILCKRKRSVKIFVEDEKRNEPEIVDESLLDDISEHTTDNQGHTSVTTAVDSSPTPLADEHNRESEPEVFRCLACFTFFIPTGNGYKEDILQNREQTSAVKKNWLSSLFSPHKEEMLVDNDVVANSVAVLEQEIDSSPLPLVVSSSLTETEVTGKYVENRGEKPAESQKEVTALPGKGSSPNEVWEENTIVKPQQDGSNIRVQPSIEASAVEKSQPDQELNTTGKKGTDDKDSLFPKPVSAYGESENNKVDLNADFLSQQNGQKIGIKQDVPIQSALEVRNVEVTFNDTSQAYGFPHNNARTKVDIHIEKTSNANADAFSPSLSTSLLLPDKQVNVTKDLVGVSEKASAGGDTIIIVTDNTQTATSQPSQNIIVSTGTNDPALIESTEDREFRGVEVIKSIVYGGLVESITSLGVVSSAAGSDTAIINIVALGLANLIGGLFVICHHLWGLKNDDYGVIYSQETENTPSQGTQRLDKYRDLLGRRENFLLHATVAILSYIIFGLIPPVIYGFSFRESSDRDFKLIAVAVASLVCITVLAVGKAYIQSPPKIYIKTVFYYIVLGFMASGASYVAGDLINKLIQKLGWLSSGVDLSVPMIVESQGQPKWSSY